MSTKALRIIYWISTVIIALIMFSSAIMQIFQFSEEFKAEMILLGFPFSFLRLLGVAKILGVAALLVPKFPRLKEWAYAGFAFTLIAASYAHFAIGIIEFPHFFIFAVLMISYCSYHKLRSGKEKAE